MEGLGALKLPAFLMLWVVAKTFCVDALALVLALASGVIFGGVLEGTLIKGGRAVCLWADQTDGWTDAHRPTQHAQYIPTKQARCTARRARRWPPWWASSSPARSSASRYGGMYGTFTLGCMHPAAPYPLLHKSLTPPSKHQKINQPQVVAQLEKRPLLRALERAVAKDGVKAVFTFRLSPLVPALPIGAGVRD